MKSVNVLIQNQEQDATLILIKQGQVCAKADSLPRWLSNHNLVFFVTQVRKLQNFSNSPGALISARCLSLWVGLPG